MHRTLLQIHPLSLFIIVQYQQQMTILSKYNPVNIGDMLSEGKLTNSMIVNFSTIQYAQQQCYATHLPVFHLCISLYSLLYYTVQQESITEEKLANLLFLSIWQKKVWQINRSAKSLIIVSTNQDGFSLANHDDSPNLPNFLPAKLFHYMIPN